MLHICLLCDTEPIVNMEGMNLPVLTLIGAGVMMLIPGVLYIFNPQMMLADAGMQLRSVNEFHVIRTAYGGAFLGTAAVFFMGAWRSELRRGALLAVVLLLGGYAFGRLVSMGLEGAPAPLYFGILSAELVFVALALLSLRR